ncbi:MAG TPA: amidohydrolase family protein [Acidimicrobiales bacterium]|nr:amidohydrolase family protein [Acidimicrobiales bacterium]
MMRGGGDSGERPFAATAPEFVDRGARLERMDAQGWGAMRVLVHLRPTPVNGRSLADPLFDPFWARAEEAGVPIVFHLSESGYHELMSVHWGELPNPSSHRQSAFQWAMFCGDRPIMDALAALIYGSGST